MGATKIVTFIIVKGVTPSCIQRNGWGEGASVTCSYTIFVLILELIDVVTSDGAVQGVP